MIAFGRRATISSTVAVCGMISEYTRASRTRRAISWAYCAPKSITSTRSWSLPGCVTRLLIRVSWSKKAAVYGGHAPLPGTCLDKHSGTHDNETGSSWQQM